MTSKEKIMKKRTFLPALSAFLLMLTMSLLSTGLSFFVTPVCNDLGFGRGSFTLYDSLITAAGAVSASFLGTHMNRRGARGVILLSAIWCGLGFLGLSVSGSLWMFYLFGAAMGLLGTTCVYLAANVIVQQTYSAEKASAVWGVVMAGSGIGGVIWSNVVPAVMANFGWRISYRVLGILWFVLATLAGLLLGRQKQSDSVGTPKNVTGGSGKKAFFKDPNFYLALFIMCVLTCASCISGQLPAILGSMVSPEQVGLLISVMTAAVAVGTILQGVLCSKWGVRNTMLCMMFLYIIGFVMLYLQVSLYAALVCMAFGSGLAGTLMPTLVRTVFGIRDYADIWSIAITCSSISSFLAKPAWGMVYDICHTYAPALMVMPVLIAVSILALVTVFRKVK